MIQTTSNPPINLTIPAIPYLNIYQKRIILVGEFYNIFNKYRYANMVISYVDTIKLYQLKKRIDNLTQILNQLWV